VYRMASLTPYLPFLLLVLASACQRHEPPGRVSLEELRAERDRVRKAVVEKHVVWQDWITHQFEAADCLEFWCGITSGPIWNRRPLMEILREQRENFRILTAKTTLSKRERKGLSEWIKYQKAAASLLARGVKSTHAVKAEEAGPADLLDQQEKDIETLMSTTKGLERELARIEAEIERRAPNPPDGSDADVEGDAGIEVNE